MHNLYLVFIFTIYVNLIFSTEQMGDCSKLKNNLAISISNFTLCSVNNSRPITLCESCLDAYIDVLDSYKNLSEELINETKCIDYYINLDRLQILQTQYSNSINLWNEAKCYECYIVENGTQTHKESEEAKQFHSYYNKFKTCTNSTNTETLCEQCMDEYISLNDYYGSISSVNEKIGLCIDLEDLMNNTWTYWSTNCCKFRRHNEYMFIGSTVAVIIITFLFYITVQFCGEKTAPTIIQQSRFAESVNRL